MGDSDKDLRRAWTPSQVDGANREAKAAAIVISPLEDDNAVLRNILSHSNWQVWFARCWMEARMVVGELRIPIIICEDKLPDATWKDVLADLEKLPKAPALIVTSWSADEKLWAEVLNLGAYDVLMKPFDATEVFRLVGLAWLNWRNAFGHTSTIP